MDGHQIVKEAIYLEERELLKLILEKTVATEKNVKELAARLGGLEKRFDGLEGRIDGLEKRFDGLEERIDGLEKRFQRVENDVNKLKEEQGMIKQAVMETNKNVKQLLENQKSTYEILSEHDVAIRAIRRRIQKLEA
ncbi:hypothetical protein CAY60_004010 [Shouchella clausii]|uniref:hypothetical protein n=1 Tax=Shouchella clausii TaxID=79880 RepID=UPI00273E98FE|nr:hypothetical protein [Shouchella clausii]MDP5256646.1 hypothetical protein [Shouchella clausii]MDP5264469.1 hypothetical protein [Shouchella clausii]MDP5282246.1 hypothetical protein [Shouchella clausii]MDP5302122.1 hypothetical protein [Shouchella clausii]